MFVVVLKRLDVDVITQFLRLCGLGAENTLHLCEAVRRHNCHILYTAFVDRMPWLPLLMICIRLVISLIATFSRPAMVLVEQVMQSLSFLRGALLCRPMQNCSNLA